MWSKIYKILFAAGFLYVSGILIYALFFSQEKDARLISKATVVLFTYILYIVRRQRPPSDHKVYEKQYQDIVGGTFEDDKKSYKQLLQVAVYYNQNQYKKAYKLIDKLLEKCRRTKDYTAVYMFQALCLDDENKLEESIQSYIKLLQYDMSNSRAWSNLGLRYMKQGKTKEAHDAYANAILYDSENAYAYNNMASYYVRTGEPEQALTYALKALELDSKVYQAMSAAAVAYKMLGDEENMEKYCKMYSVNGGNAKELRATLAKM